MSRFEPNSLSFYENLLQSALFLEGPIVIFIWRNEEGWPVEAVSKNIQRIFGYSPEDYTSGRLSYANQIHPEDLEHVFQEVTQNSQKNEISFRHQPYRYQTQDQAYCWVDDTTTVIRNEQNEITHYVGYLIDITESIRLSESSKMWKERFELAWLGSNDGIWDWEIPEKRVYFSPRWKEMLGYEEVEFPNQINVFFKQVHPEDLPLLETALTKHFEDPEHHQYDLEIRIRCKDGQYKWIRSRGKVILNEHQQAVRMSGSHTDITPQKENEKTLNSLLSLQSAILDNAAYAILTTDADGMIQTLNRAAEEMLGYQTEEVKGKYTPSIFHDMSEVMEKADKYSKMLQEPFSYGFETLIAKTKKGLPNTEEWTYLHKDGKQIPVQTSTTALKDAQGETLGYMTIANDISERKLSQQRLQAANQAYNELVNRIPVGIFTFEASSDHQFILSYASQQFFDLLNFAENDEYSDLMLGLLNVHPEDFPRINLILKTAVKQRQALHWEGRYCLGDQQFRWLKFEASIITNQQGIQQWNGIVQDISKAKEAEIALNHNRNMLNQAQHLAKLGSWTYNHESHELTWSDETYRIFQVTPQSFELTYENFLNLIGADEREKVRSQIATSIKEKTPFNIPHAIQTDHTLKHVIQRGETLYNVLGDPALTRGTIQDITELKSLQSDLVTEQSFSNSIVDNANSIIAVIDTRDGTMIRFNEYGQKLTGFSQEEVARTPFFWKTFLLPKDRKQLNKLIKNAREGRIAKRFESGWLTSKGDVRWFDWSNALIPDEQGEMTYLLTIGADVTQEREIKQELVLAKDAAEQANRAKSAFLANMSHEIRTPMNAILGLNELVLKTHLNTKQRDYLTKLSQSSKSLLSILNDILDHAKIEENKLEILHEPFDMQHLINTVTTLYQTSIEQKSLEFKQYIPDDLPQQVIGDELRIQQILSNLISNAIKFTEHGQITLEVASKQIDDQQVNFTFTIRDTGIGIEPEILDKLFQPFTQADSSITRKYGGTGLGLSICQSLIDLMHGYFAVQSQSGKGSEFAFTMPLQINKDPSTLFSPAALKTTSQDALIALAQEQLGQFNLLVVEDNPINQAVVQGMLDQLHLKPIMANNGQEALSQLEKQSFDLVLMDMHMPVMDGLEATKTLKKDSPELPVIAMTAAAMEQDRQACLQAGMEDRLIKPFSLIELTEMLLKYGAPQAFEVLQNTQVIEAAPLSSSPEKDEQQATVTEVEQIASRMGVSEEQAQMLLGLFLNSYQAIEAQYQALILAKDWTELKEQLHQLKGAAGSLQLLTFKQIIEPIEADLIAQQSLEMAALQPILQQTQLICETIQRMQSA